MEKTSKVLADYIIKKGMAEEKDREVYEYGFVVAMESGLFVLACIIASLYLHMIVEGGLFFMIFVPLRSYAGGLHLNKFYSCFALSCLTFWAILMVARNAHMPIVATAIIIEILEICVYLLYPVENINRTVDSGENRRFRKRLEKVLFMHLAIAIVCVVLNYERYIVVIAATYVMVVITMIIGKWKAEK